VTGESSYQRMSSWSLASTMSRRLLRSRICRRSSRRNSRIASLSCSTAGRVPVTTQYGLLHYANLIRRTGPICFLFNLLNLATPLLSYAVCLVLLTLVPLSSLPCYLYDAVLILTSDILYSLIDTFLSILRYISTHVFVVKP
jgi:hypothetical protein